MDTWTSKPVLTCQSCGTELPSDAKFCWQCGTPVYPGTAPATSAGASDPSLVAELHDIISEAFRYKADGDTGYGVSYKIKKILEKSPQVANAPFGKERRTALHRLMEGNPRRELREDGKLNFAVAEWRVLSARAVMETPGIDLDAQDWKGQTALHLAIACTKQLPWGSDDIRDDLLDPFMFDHQHELITELLDLGADPNIADRDGETPVHLAAEKGRCMVLHFLLKRGGDPDVVNNRGWTPMHYAHQYNFPRVIDSLQEAIDLKAGIPVPLPEPLRPTPRDED